MTPARVLAEPDLTHDQIRAVLRYAAWLAGQETPACSQSRRAAVPIFAQQPGRACEGQLAVRRWLALVLVVAAGCRVAKYALLPPINSPGSSRDPDRTRPLVENYEAPPYSSKESAPGRAPDDPLEIPVPGGKIAGAVSSAAVLLFLLGGAGPLIGVFGEFDENDLAPR